MKTWYINLLLLLTASSLIALAVTEWRHSDSSLLIVGLALIGLAAVMIMSIFIGRLSRLLSKSVRLLTNENQAEPASLPSLIEKKNQQFKLVSEHIKLMGVVKEMPSVPEALQQEEIGQALQTVQVQMKTMKEEEDQQHWITEGLAKFAELLRKKSNINDYSAQIISTLVKYVNANQGGLFLENETEEEGRYLELTGSYAYDKRKYISKKIFPGEGMIGQCMYEKDVIYIKNVPKDYVQITSGLGLATPRNLIVVPLLMNDVFYGAFELASFELLQDHQIEFLRKVAVMIASEVSAIKTLEHTKTLLAESDKLSQKLQAHEEEMRMNMEELAATQEEMSRNQVELEKKQAELGSYLSAIDNTIASAEFKLDGTFNNANKLFLTITGYSFHDLKGKTCREIFNNDHALEVMWTSLQAGKFFSGEFKMFDHARKELWLNGTLNPILDATGRPEKIMLFAHFTTQEKEKQNEMNAIIQAMKQTFAVLELSTEFQCKSANEKFLKHFGISRLKLREHKLCDFMVDKKFCSGFLTSQRELLQNQPFNQMLEFEVGGKREYWEVSFSMIRDLSGKEQHILMIMVHETVSEMARVVI